MNPEDITKTCPGCLQEMKQHPVGSGMFGISTMIVFLCKNESCKFHNIPRLVSKEDLK